MERICMPRNIFFLLRVDPVFEGVFFAQGSKKMVLFCKNGRVTIYNSSSEALRENLKRVK